MSELQGDAVAMPHPAAKAGHPTGEEAVTPPALCTASEVPREDEIGSHRQESQVVETLPFVPDAGSVAVHTSSQHANTLSQEATDLLVPAVTVAVPPGETTTSIPGATEARFVSGSAVSKVPQDVAFLYEASVSVDLGLSAAVLDSLPDATATLDKDGRIVLVNHAWRMFAVDNGGPPETTGVGVNYLTVCTRAAQAGCADSAAVAAGLRAVLAGESTHSEMEYACPSPAARRWFLLRINRLVGPTPGAVISHVNITRRKAAEDLIAHQASHDPLTGLANRRLFVDRLEVALAQSRSVQELGVVFLDLDGFKGVNDTYGHGAGDEVLLVAAHRLEGVADPQDIVARLGGDEFAILARRSSAAALEELCGRVSEVLTEPHLVHGDLLDVPGSVGMTLAAVGEASTVVMRRADKAMYAVKHARPRRPL